MYEIELDNKWFTFVKNKYKMYEVRINVGKHSKVKELEDITIVNNQTKEKLHGIITSVDIYDSFEKLFKDKHKSLITPNIDNPIEDVYYKIPGYKDNEYLGVVCIGLDIK